MKPEEGETVDQMKQSFEHILDTTSKDYGHGVRAVHAKAHGIIRGKLKVHDGLPPELAQGLFAKPGEYEAVGRISTNPGDILDDAIGLPRGFALKVIGVEGERLPGSEGDTTQDFVMANAPAFTAPTADAFAKNLKMLASTTDKFEGARSCCPASCAGSRRRWRRSGSRAPRSRRSAGPSRSIRWVRPITARRRSAMATISPSSACSRSARR